MHVLTLMLALLPGLTVLPAWYTLYPVKATDGAARLAMLRVAVLVGSYAVASVEVLSITGWLNRVGVCIVWLVGLLAASIAGLVRYRRNPVWRQAPPWARPGIVEHLIIIVLAALAVGTFVLALTAEPNNWDSQAYHLPKVEQWVATGSVDLFPTPFFSQAALAPGGEYLLLHLRLLTGGDALNNLVQWAAALLCGVAASLVAARLGASRLGQLVAAFIVATAPMVVVQASNTQTDLLVAAWCACVAAFVVDAVGRDRLGMVEVLQIGMAVGLAAVTKSTSFVVLGPLLVLWFVIRAWRVKSAPAPVTLAAAALGVAAVALLITGPFLARITDAFGSPLGPAELRKHALERHDVSAVTLNAARILQNATLVPNDDVNDFTARAVERLARVLGEDVLDPETTRADSYPVPFYKGPDEDFAAFPLQVAIVGASLAYCLLRHRRDRLLVGYALGAVVMAVGYSATIKWQWYGNRFLLADLVIAAPLGGLAADAVSRRFRTAARWRVTGALILVVVTAGIGGVDAVLNGSPRPLYGPSSVLATKPWQTRFARVPMYQADYEWAAAKVRAAGAHRVGMVVGGELFEYPWWMMMRDRQLVNLEPMVPGHPAPPPTTVDAVVCFVPPPTNCTDFVPDGWTLRRRTSIAVALPTEFA